MTQILEFQSGQLKRIWLFSKNSSQWPILWPDFCIQRVAWKRSLLSEIQAGCGLCWQVVSVWWWLLICVWQFIYLLKQGVYNVTSDLDPFLSRENILLRHRVLGKSQAWSDVQPWPSWCLRKPKPDLQSCREQKHLAGVLLGSIIINKALNLIACQE